MLDSARIAEQQKYEAAYALPNYRMGEGRKIDAIHDLGKLRRGSYLDVGCGRGEMLDEAERIGFAPVMGVEVVPALLREGRVIYAQAHQLPFEDASFDVVSLFDVIEHIPQGDDEVICRELARVARRTILITANNNPSRLPDGTELHINIRSHQEWDACFKTWFAPFTVTRIGGVRHYPASPGWVAER